MTREFLEDAESARSGPSHVPCQPLILPLCRVPVGLLSRNNQPPDIWNSRRDSENEQIRIFLERQKEQILADCRAEIQKHEFQSDSDRRSIQELTGIIESQRREIDHALARDEQLRRDQQLLHERTKSGSS